MKKVVAMVLSLVMAFGLMAGCGQKDSGGGAKTVESLKIAFSPYADADQITTATEPLEALLKAKLLEKGYDVQNIDMTVGTSYTAVGEALSAGSADIGNYVLFSDDCDVLLTALRYGINKDSENAADWNDGTLEENTQDMTTYYRSIILAGPSAKGQALLAKVNSGEELTWDDLNGATWSVLAPTSASGYIYPSLWLQEHYGKTIADLDHVVQSDSHSTSLARLATGQADVMVSFGHIRIARRSARRSSRSPRPTRASRSSASSARSVTPGARTPTMTASAMRRPCSSRRGSNTMLLEAAHICKRFGARPPVLTDVTFGLEAGEFVSVIGPSGAGKTTLFRILNGTLPCDSGEVCIGGQPFSRARGRKKRAVQKRIGTIYQDFALVEPVTCRQNVLNACLPDMSLQASLLGLFSRAQTAEAERLLARVGLADKCDEPVCSLSGGQKQRVAIARALMRKPALLLADEPVASLDPVTGRQILALLQDISRTEGVAILMNSHNLDQSRAVSSRLLGLHAGRIVLDCAPDAVTDADLARIYGGAESEAAP